MEASGQSGGRQRLAQTHIRRHAKLHRNARRPRRASSASFTESGKALAAATALLRRRWTTPRASATRWATERSNVSNTPSGGKKSSKLSGRAQARTRRARAWAIWTWRIAWLIRRSVRLGWGRGCLQIRQRIVARAGLPTGPDTPRLDERWYGISQRSQHALLHLPER